MHGRVANKILQGWNFIWELDADIETCIVYGCTAENYVEPLLHIQHRFCNMWHARLYQKQIAAALVIQRQFRCAFLRCVLIDESFEHLDEVN